MDIATVLFTYNRSQHTGKVLDALSKNTVLPEKLYIFQDGLKREEHRVEWEKVNDLIHKVDFCPTQLWVRDQNIGVAASVVSGINYVLENHDAVIVIEDDCVPAVSFERFMVQCMEKYMDNKQVWCVGGCADPVELKKDRYDVYGCGRTSSSGWGTWKDRWEKFSFDYNVLKRLRGDKNGSRVLATWGNDCEEMLLNDVAGRSDAWDIYWTLLVFENAGICVLPYESLIQNIGFDGSGVHSGTSDKYDVNVSDEIVSEFVLPAQIELLQTTKEAYVDLYGSYTAINLEAASKENVIIYGLGRFFRQFEKDINERYYINAFIDRRQNGWYAGKKIIGLNEIAQYGYSKIVIMVQNIQESIRVIRELLDKGVDAGQIVLGHELYGKHGKKFDKISVLADSRLLFSLGNISIKVESKEQFVHVHEVFVDQIYNYNINNEKRDIVLDVGIETGDTAIYFLHQSSVEKVYGYTFLERDFMTAKENLADYYSKSGGIEISQYDINHIVALIGKAPDYNIILKLEGRGRESDILKELSQRGVLDRLTVIMIRTCLKEMGIIESLLKESGFSWRKSDTNNNEGLVYAYRC